MITWEGLLTSVLGVLDCPCSSSSPSVFVTDLNNGGAAGLVYGYLFVWAGSILQVLVMAELGSMYAVVPEQTFLLLTSA